MLAQSAGPRYINDGFFEMPKEKVVIFKMMVDNTPKTPETWDSYEAMVLPLEMFDKSISNGEIIPV